MCAPAWRAWQRRPRRTRACHGEVACAIGTTADIMEENGEVERDAESRPLPRRRCAHTTRCATVRVAHVSCSIRVPDYNITDVIMQEVHISDPRTGVCSGKVATALFKARRRGTSSLPGQDRRMEKLATVTPK